MKDHPGGASPRLYFRADDVPSLRQRFDSVPALRAAHRRLVADARKALAVELPGEDHALAGSGQHGNYSEVVGIARRVIETCAFAYAITGEQELADRGAQALRHFAQYESWTGAMFRSWDPPWNSALETATFTQAYAVGIDWLGATLSEPDRKTACAALARLGVGPLVGDWLDPDTRIHALDSMGHNWWMVCVAAAGVGALALLGDDPRAEGWLQMVVEGLPEFFRYPGSVLQSKMASFDPDGGFYESLGYTNYTLVHYAYLMAALRHMFPDDPRFRTLAPELDGMVEFMLHFLYPTSGGFLTVDFGDHHREHAFSGDVTLFLARATRDGRYRWYFDRCSREVSGPYQMLSFDESVKPRPPDELPPNRALTGIGWAAMRDSWEDDARLVAIKCGDTWNHAHADAGSFVVYAGGEPLLIDSGTCSYGRPEYRSYYTEAVAHNTVLLDGRGPSSEDVYRGSKFRGRIYPFLDDPHVRYLMADATGPFAALYRRFLRHFLWLDGVIVLYDDLLAHEPAHFEWLFHGETCPEFRDGVLSVEGDSPRLEMSVLQPQGLDAQLHDGCAPGAPGRRLQYVALRRRSAEVDAKFLGVIRAGRQLADADIRSTEGDEWIGAQVQSAPCRWDVYCNLRADGRRMHRNSNLRMGPWDTDAYLMAERHAEAGRLLLIGASYVRDAEGAVWFDCLSKCNAVLTVAGGEVTEATLQCPPGSRVGIGRAAPGMAAMANGETLDTSDSVRVASLLMLQVPE